MTESSSNSTDSINLVANNSSTESAAAPLCGNLSIKPALNNVSAGNVVLIPDGSSSDSKSSGIASSESDNFKVIGENLSEEIASVINAALSQLGEFKADVLSEVDTVVRTAASNHNNNDEERAALFVKLSAEIEERFEKKKIELLKIIDEKIAVEVDQRSRVIFSTTIQPSVDEAKGEIQSAVSQAVETLEKRAQPGDATLRRDLNTATQRIAKLETQVLTLSDMVTKLLKALNSHK